MTDRVPDHQQCLLIYDGDCRLCVTAKAGLERWGGESPDQPVRFVPYQSDEAVRRLGAEYRPGRPDVAFLVRPDGTIQRGLEAFLPLLPGLPGGRLFLILARIPFLKPLAVLAYRLVARNRYRWFGAVTNSR
jgi:predicted DCC family thiol-disulfide oxidoreductase YuxK